MRAVLNLMLLFTLLSYLELGAESKIPYTSISRLFKGLDSEEKLPFAVIYLKFKKDNSLAPNGKFRIEQDGKITPLKTQDLNAANSDLMSEEDKVYLKKGYTRKIYIPIDDAKYEGAQLVHDLEKGAFEFELKIQIKVKEKSERTIGVENLK